MIRDTSQPDPGVILELLEAFRRSKAMFAAVSLGIFDALEEGPKSLTGLAEGLEVNPDALERLLDACIGLHLLDRRGDEYENTPVASAYLCKRSPSRLTGYIGYSNDVMWKLWGNLEGAIREGTHRWQQTFGWDGPIFSHFFRTEEALREFLMGMHGYGVISSPHVVTAFDLGQYERLVDLGGATGHLAIAACHRYPNLHAVVFDLPGAIPLAKEITGAAPEADRIEFDGRRLLHGSPARGGPLRTRPHPPRLVGTQGHPTADAHLREAAVGRGLADRREAPGRRQAWSPLGPVAEPEHVDLHRGQGAELPGIRIPAQTGRVLPGVGGKDPGAARRDPRREGITGLAGF